MDCNGKRWACRSDYKCHIKDNGKIVGLTNDFYEDAGWSPNESPIEGHSTFTAVNCYDLNGDNFKNNGNAVLISHSASIEIDIQEDQVLGTAGQGSEGHLPDGSAVSLYHGAPDNCGHSL